MNIMSAQFLKRNKNVPILAEVRGQTIPDDVPIPKYRFFSVFAISASFKLTWLSLEVTSKSEVFNIS